jgi:hypothetical protein
MVKSFTLLGAGVAIFSILLKVRALQLAPPPQQQQPLWASNPSAVVVKSIMAMQTIAQLFSFRICMQSLF